MQRAEEHPEKGQLKDQRRKGQPAGRGLRAVTLGVMTERDESEAGRDLQARVRMEVSF